MASDSDGELDATYSCMEQPPLIKQLRGILSEYPDNGQIIKELLQNAEDARASEVEIIYDERVINQTEDKKKPFRKFFKGPALCVKNNSLFEEEDWKGIKMIASSVKEDDKLKVGRFGLGFKSVFHLTDFPCIISGDRVLLVDPTRPSDQVNAEMKFKDMRRIKGMDVEAFLDAFRDNLGIDESIINQGHYPGTVFWFPLRDQTSKISSTLYDKDKMMDLFASFEHDSSEILLFLCHLECVSLHIKTTSGQTSKVAGAEITDNKLDVREKRKEFVRLIKTSSYPHHNPFICSYNMHVRTSNRHGRLDDTKWIIVHYFMGNNSSQRLQTLVHDVDLGYNPLVGVAMPASSSSTEPFEGHVFCFLPLPKEGSRLTGLPVHVNGFFSLSQNRHHLKWATNDQSGLTVKDKNILWNQTLIEECIPEAYKKLFEILLHESRQVGNTEPSVKVTYKAVPDSSIVLDKWKTIPDRLRTHLSQLSFLYSNSQQKYVAINEAMFATFRTLSPSLSQYKEDVVYTISRMNVSYVPTSVSQYKEDVVYTISRMNVSYVPTSVDTFQKLHFYNGGSVNDLTPVTFADMIRRDSRILGQLNRSQKYSVLTYLMSGDNYSCLHGLPLLPVASGNWLTYGKGDPVFLCSSGDEKDIFPEFTNRLVVRSTEHDEYLWNHFKQMVSIGACQLKTLDTNSLRDFLTRSLQHKVGQSYTITNQTQLVWFQKVWEFIKRKPVSIDTIQDVRLVPEMKSDGQWNGVWEIQLHSFSSLFLKKNGLSEEICACFTKLGVTTLPDLPSWFPKDEINHILYSSQNSSINNLLSNLWALQNRNSNVDRFNREVSAHNKDRFVEYISKVGGLDTSSIGLLRLLTMFRLGSQPSRVDIYESYTSVNACTRFVTETSIPVRLPRSFILITHVDGAHQLLTHLGATEENRISLVTMILTEMINRRHYNQNEIGQFMQYFIENFRDFEHSHTLQGLAKEIHFVATDSRKVRPGDLFNPDNQTLRNLFEGQKDKFPLFLTGMSARSKSALKDLGLKETYMVTANDVAESAAFIDSWRSDNNKHAMCVTKSTAILTLLNAETSLLQQSVNRNTLLNHLKQIKFISCQQQRPMHYPSSLPWYSEAFCKPCEARIKVYENECLVGSTMPLVEPTCDRLFSAFNWNSKPHLDKVTDQLLHIKQFYRIHEKSNVLPLVKQIYGFMSNNVMAIDMNRIKTGGLVWTGDSFESPEDVVIALKNFDLHNLMPYIFVIPSEFAVYATFFNTVGCYPEQTATVLIRVLDKIQKNHQYKQTTEQFDKDCEIVQKVVEKLAEKRGELAGGDVLLPIQTKKLNQLQFYPATKCTFDKNASMFEHEEGDNTIVFVSDIISLEAAKSLGARPLSKQILSGTETIGIEGYGQSEKLTDRIRKLITESYVDGLSVPKELIQNADDAGATVVKFLYDEREHDDARTLLLSKDMAGCQGPSFVVYNNATFTEADFKNITRLNGATKEMDGNKIGRFGLGFCAVYNLTDVPSFISKSNIVIFDPQKTYLTDALEDNSPGIKIDFRKVENKKLLRIHADQFKPFNGLFTCDVDRLTDTGFDGTLFRFPLRTSGQAKRSEISNVCYSRDEVHELLSKFIESAGNMLLFTQNVEKVELYHLPREAKSVSEQVLLFTATKNRVNSLPYSPNYTQHSTVLKRVTSDLVAHKHFKEHEHLTIKVQVTPECLSFVPRLKVSQNTIESAWYVVWETGQNESLSLSKQIADKRAIPLSAVAVQCDDLFTRPLRKSELRSLFYTTGYIFCFLPLPIKTNLNVQLNGSFDVTSDRRRLVTLTDDDKNSRQNKWNEFILSDACVNAFFTLLNHFTSGTREDFYCFHELWPSDCEQVAKPFSESFFKRVIGENKRLFFGKGQWVSFSESIFFCQSLRKHPDIGQIGFDMLSNIGENRGKILVDIPEHVAKCIEEFHDMASSSIMEPEFLEMFILHINHKYWNGRTQERNTLLKYALKSNNAEVNNIIKDSSCIPVEPHGTLKRPSEVVDKNGTLSTLFTADEEVFLHDDLQQRDIIEELLKLGMIKDILPTRVLVDRLSTIEQLASEKCTCCALRRCQLILQYLNSYTVRRELEESTIVKESVANMYILPVLKMPKNWCFSWNSTNSNEQNNKDLKSFDHSTSCTDHAQEAPRDLLLGKTATLFNKHVYMAGATVINVVDEALLQRRYASMINRDVFEILGVKSSLPNDVIVKHMTVLSSEYNEGDEQYKKLQAIFNTVTDMLQSRLKGAVKPEPHSTVQNELKKLENTPVVLVGQNLYLPRKVAFELEQECPPHLIKLPASDAFTKRELFETIGVKQKFTADYIIEVLKKKKLFWGEQPCDEIDTIKTLLQNLDKCDEITVPENNEDIVAPDIHRRLYPMHELVIADDEFETDVFMHILHKSIAPAIAEKLGAKHKQRKCYDDITTSIGMPFGQKEKLVSRIRNLLNAYPCDSSIMKELLQNADDARASEIHFIKDHRTHSTNRIFGPSCENLQGPSLCVFNDSYFTEQDLRGIHDLGEGSKRQDPTKTGQYGVGFNAVYHLTDTPSFMTKGPGLPDDGLLVIFDPTCNHLPGVTNDEPGMKWDIKNVKGNFPDVVTGFSIGDRLLKGGIGTLFRFPLRSSESPISKYTHSDTSINGILQDMSKDMFESLLFVQNVECITISNVTSGELIEEYSVKTSISDADREKRSHFFEDVQRLCKDLKSDKSSLLTIKMREVCYQMSIVDSKGRNENYLIVQRFGLDSATQIPENVIEAFRDDRLGSSPLGGVAQRLSRHAPRKHVSAMISNIESYSIQTNSHHRETRDNQTSPCNRSKVFCFLPIPGDTPLPVHVNGHFALDEARRDLFKDGYRKNWNELLLKNVVVPAYIQCMLSWRDLLSEGFKNAKQWGSVNSNSELYHSIFPLMIEMNNPYWIFLTTKLYESIITSKYPLFPVIKAKAESDSSENTVNKPKDKTTFTFECDWVPLGIEGDSGNGHFNTLIYEDMFNYYSRCIADQRRLESVLKDMNMRSIHTSCNVKKAIENCKLEHPACTNPDAVVRFVSTATDENGPCKIGSLKSNIHSTTIRTVENLSLLVTFMKTSKLFVPTLQRLPILLTDANKLYAFRKEVKIYCSEFGWMFPAAKDMFIHHDLLFTYPDKLQEDGYIKEFSIEPFIQLTLEQFKESLYKPEPILLWNQNSDNFPSVKWIAWLWKFICTISKKTPNEGSTFSENVARLSELALIPAFKEKDPKLVKISKAYMLIDMVSLYKNEKLQISIAKLKPLELDRQVFFQERYHYEDFENEKIASSIFYEVKSLTTSIDKPERLLEFLHCQIEFHGQSVFASFIDTDDAICILQYFSQNMTNKKLIEHQNVKTTLLSLPLFVTLNNECVHIDPRKRVFVVPSEMPVDGLDIVSLRTNVVFLKKQQSLHDLYEFLALSDMTVCSLYADIVLPNISLMPRQLWLIHVKYLRDNVIATGYAAEQDPAKMAIVRILRNVDFVDTKAGYKYCYELFYHGDPYFNELCSCEQFPPIQFRNYSWKHFLETLGMHTKVTDDLLIKFARSIENGQRTDQDTEKKSKTLQQCFSARINEWKKETLFALASIRFISPLKLKRMYRTIFHSKADGVGLIPMQGAVGSKHVEVCWSTLNVLPFIVDKDYHTHLGIHTEPPLLDVLKHFQNVSTEMRKNLHGKRNDIIFLMKKLYSFLQKHATYPLAKDMLFTFPIVHLPEERKMVTVNDIAIELSRDEAVRPYLFKAPVEYGPFFALFMSLGTSSEVKCYHYQNVLFQIKVAVGEEELTPPELRDVGRALKCLYQSLMNPSRQEFKNNTNLYVPDDKHLLCNSTELVIMDNDLIKERMSQIREIRYFTGFREMELDDLDSSKFVNMLPERFRPQLLTGIVDERFNRENMQVIQDSHVAATITSFIRSDEFVKGLCRIFKKHIESGSRTFDKVKDVDRIKHRLLQINFIEVAALETCLWYKGNIVVGSNRPKTCFFEVDSDDNETFVNFYFKTSGHFKSNLINLICHPGGLSRALIEYIELPTDEITVLLIVSMSRSMENPENIATLLDEHRYPLLHVDTGLHTYSAFPSPGTYVEERFLPFIDHSMNIFDENEFLNLAMEIEDELLDTDRDDQAEVSPIYIYVHIKREISRNGENLSLVNMKYLVDVGEADYIEVSGFRLFRFVRPQNSTNSVTVYTGQTPQQFLPFDENCRRIRWQLQDAWTLPDRDRRRIIRRLLFHWHPDRNRGSEEYATKMFNYIKQSVLRLEGTGSLDDEDETDGQPADFSRSNYNSMFSNMGRRAQSYARAYYDNIDDYNTNQRSGNYSHRNASSGVVIDVNEARRWMKQANHDLQAATAFLPEAEVDDRKSFNWICYMCHQATEKALKAACYAKNANEVSLQDHSLIQPASILSPTMADLARRMESHLGIHTRMRYPNSVSRPQIPADIYTKNHAEVAIEIAKEIIDASDDLIN